MAAGHIMTGHDWEDPIRRRCGCVRHCFQKSVFLPIQNTTQPNTSQLCFQTSPFKGFCVLKLKCCSVDADIVFKSSYFCVSINPSIFFLQPLEHFMKPLLCHYGTINLTTRTKTNQIIWRMKEGMNKWELMCRKTTHHTVQIIIHYHTQSTAGYVAIKMIPSDRKHSVLVQAWSVTSRSGVHSAVTGRESSLCVYVSCRPCRPSCCRWICRRSPAWHLYLPGKFWKQPVERQSVFTCSSLFCDRAYSHGSRFNVTSLSQRGAWI